MKTVLANLKTLINGGHKGIEFRKFAEHYLSAFACRFNARLFLREVLHSLLGHAAASPTREHRVRCEAEVHDPSGQWIMGAVVRCDTDLLLQSTAQLPVVRSVQAQDRPAFYVVRVLAYRARERGSCETHIATSTECVAG